MTKFLTKKNSTEKKLTQRPPFCSAPLSSTTDNIFVSWSVKKKEKKINLEKKIYSER